MKGNKASQNTDRGRNAAASQIGMPFVKVSIQKSKTDKSRKHKRNSLRLISKIAVSVFRYTDHIFGAEFIYRNDQGCQGARDRAKDHCGKNQIEKHVSVLFVHGPHSL